MSGFCYSATAEIAGMTIVRVYGEGPHNDPETCVAEEFVSLEDTPLVMAEIRAALPQFKAALMARWPIITGIQIENRRITRRQNPFDPAQAAMDATIGIVIVFFFEAAKAAGKKVGEATGDQIVEIIEAVKAG
jgi:hypothetical protein